MLVILWRWQGWIWAKGGITLQVIVCVPEALPKTLLSPVFKARFVPRCEQRHLRGTVQVCLSLMPSLGRIQPGNPAVSQVLVKSSFSCFLRGDNAPTIPPCWEKAYGVGDMSTAGSSHWSVPNACSKLSEGSSEGQMILAPGHLSLGLSWGKATSVLATKEKCKEELSNLCPKSERCKLWEVWAIINV